MKNCEEWSLEFDLLYNNITSNQAPGLTEYEKSVFLTRAEESVCVMLYNGALKKLEETEENTDYLASLVSQASCPEVTDGSVPKIIPSSQVFSLPSDYLFRTLELCTISPESCGDRQVIVVPITQDEYWRTSRNPFKKQNANRVLRLAYSSATESFGDLQRTDYSELISDFPIKDYTVRYVRKPDPIILVDLTDDELSINGQRTAQTCKLNEQLHQTILTEAVRLAKAVWKA